MNRYPYRVAEVRADCPDDEVSTATVHGFRIMENDNNDEITACGRYVDFDWSCRAWVNKHNDEPVTCLHCIAKGL